MHRVESRHRINKIYFKSSRCLAVVDGLLFLEHPEYVSTHWKFIHEKKIIGQGNFASKVQSHLRLVNPAEVCSGLGALILTKQIMISSRSNVKINFTLGSNCQSTMHKFDLRQVSFDSKLSCIIRKILQMLHEELSNSKDSRTLR